MGGEWRTTAKDSEIAREARIEKMKKKTIVTMATSFLMTRIPRGELVYIFQLVVQI